MGPGHRQFRKTASVHGVWENGNIDRRLRMMVFGHDDRKHRYMWYRRRGHTIGQRGHDETKRATGFMDASERRVFVWSDYSRQEERIHTY